MPAGSSILDLPCGSGRLIPLLLERGYQYTGADVSSHMVEAARTKFESLTASADAGAYAAARFGTEDITSLSYEDDSFDAVIVNRLFHHFTLAETRIAALKELGRVCPGPIIVFFLNTWTLRGIQFHLRHSLDRVKARSPITMKEFRTNGAAAGLEMTASYRTRSHYNKEWYAVFRRNA